MLGSDGGLSGGMTWMTKLSMFVLVAVSFLTAFTRTMTVIVSTTGVPDSISNLFKQVRHGEAHHHTQESDKDIMEYIPSDLSRRSGLGITDNINSRGASNNSGDTNVGTESVDAGHVTSTPDSNNVANLIDRIKTPEARLEKMQREDPQTNRDRVS